MKIMFCDDSQVGEEFCRNLSKARIQVRGESKFFQLHSELGWGVSQKLVKCKSSKSF